MTNEEIRKEIAGVSDELRLKRERKARRKREEKAHERKLQTLSSQISLEARNSEALHLWHGIRLA